MNNYDVWRSVEGLTGNHWKAYQADVRKNGDYCASCHKRFLSVYKALVCDECAESAVVRMDRRPDLKYRQYVYALFSNGEVIYIGVTKSPLTRLQQHLVDKDFDSMGLIKGFSTRPKAEEFEEFCIEHYTPQHNKRVKASKRKIPWQWKQDLERISPSGSVDE